MLTLGDVKMIIKLATSEFLVEQAREIFREYQVSLGIDLCFQNFEQELASLPGNYASPYGRLYLAFIDDALVGCIALRPFQKKQCEMKRLYVRPQFRAKNIGRILANKVIEEARQIGYHQILLDTLHSMTAAQKLYSLLGFQKYQPYCYNPLEGVQYLSLELQVNKPIPNCIRL
jgi:ribosomal protein S18 acetylase RimI-like enzyme